LTAKEKLLYMIDNMDDEQINALAAQLMSKMPKRIPCPCCGNYTFEGSLEDCAWEICDVCFWEFEPSVKNPEDLSGANHMSLGEARENYRKFGACDVSSIDSVRPPHFDELPEFYN